MTEALVSLNRIDTQKIVYENKLNRDLCNVYTESVVKQMTQLEKSIIIAVYWTEYSAGYQMC